MKEIKKLKAGKPVVTKRSTNTQLKNGWDAWFRSELKKGNPPSPISKKDFPQLKEDVLELNLELIDFSDPAMPLKVQYLKDNVPAPVSTTIFGVEDVEVNDFEKFKFIEEVRTVFHPDYLLESAEYGALSNHAMDTLIAVHPDYLEATRLVIAELMLEYRTKPAKAPKTLNRTKQGILAKVFQQSRFSPEVIQNFQAQYVSEDRPEQRSTTDVNIGEAALTPSQRIANK